MSKKMFIDASQKDETRMAIVEDDRLIEYESEFLKLKPTKGNIYLAKIIRVEPSLQAAFVDYGAQRHGFLAYNEIHPDYFKIPAADEIKIKELNEKINKNDEDEEINKELFAKAVQAEGFLLKSGYLKYIYKYFS